MYKHIYLYYNNNVFAIYIRYTSGKLYFSSYLNNIRLEDLRIYIIFVSFSQVTQEYIKYIFEKFLSRNEKVLSNINVFFFFVVHLTSSLDWSNLFLLFLCTQNRTKLSSNKNRFLKEKVFTM